MIRICLGLGGRRDRRRIRPSLPLLPLCFVAVLAPSVLWAQTRTPQPTNTLEPTNTVKPTRTAINPLATDTPTPKGNTVTPTRTRPGNPTGTPTLNAASPTSTLKVIQPTATRTRPVGIPTATSTSGGAATPTFTIFVVNPTPTRTRPVNNNPTPTRTLPVQVGTSTRTPTFVVFGTPTRTKTPGIGIPTNTAKPGTTKAATRTPKPTSTPRNNGPLPVSFRSGREFDAGGAPTYIAMADFNRDGIPDAALASRTQNTLKILLGIRPNAFRDGPAAPATGREPVGVIAVDLNGDNKTDLVTAEATDGTVSTYFNDGNGAFNIGQRLDVDGEPSGIALFGSRIAVSDRRNSRVIVLNRSGEGLLSVGDTVATGAEPVAIAVADMNRDDSPDLITADDIGQSVTVILSTPTGFAAAHSTAVLSFPGALAIQDYEGDGCPDFAITLPFNDMIAVYRQASTGGGTQNVCLGDYAQTFTADVPSPGFILMPDDQSIRLSGDTFPDLLVLSPGAALLSIFQGQVPNANPPFALTSRFTVGKGATSLGLAQIDRDAEDFIDLVLANSGGDSAQVIRNSGNGSFIAPVTFNTDLGPSAVVMGDFDWQKDCSGEVNTCTTDVLTANLNAGTVTFLPGNGLGNLRRAVETDVLVAPSLMATGDFHNSGRLDVVIGSTINANAALYHSNGDGTFTAERQLALAGAPTGFAVGDYDQNGHPDLALGWSEAPASGVDLFADLPGSEFARLQLSATGAPASVGFADVNSDGLQDIVALIPETQQIDVWYQLQDGRFFDVTTFDTEVRPTHMALADVDGDGLLDAIVANRETFNFAIMRNRSGGFSPPQFFALEDQPIDVMAGDFNLDGAADLAFISDTSGRLTVFAGEGDGRFPDTAVTKFAVGVEPPTFAIGQLTNDPSRGDALPDIVVADYPTDRVTTLRNNSDVPRVDPTPRPTSTPRPVAGTSGGGCNLGGGEGGGLLILLAAVGALVLRTYSGGRRA